MRVCLTARTKLRIQLCFYVAITIGIGACSHKDDNISLGTLERNSVSLKATAAEIITNLPLAEGQDIDVGDIVATLDNRRQNAIVMKAKANLESSQAQLKKLRNGARSEDIAAAQSQVDGANAQLIEAQKSFDRTSSLVVNKLASLGELDAARAKRDLANSNFRQTQEHLLVLTNGTRPEDLQQAQAQVAIAQAALMIEQQNLDDLTIRASRQGRLDHIIKHVGERTSVGEIVATILDSSAPYARVYIAQSQRANVYSGQKFVVHIDGIENPLTGTLRWVSQEPAFTPYFALNSKDRSRLVYLAEITLPENAKDLPSGLPVQVAPSHE